MKLPMKLPMKLTVKLSKLATLFCVLMGIQTYALAQQEYGVSFHNNSNYSPYYDASLSNTPSVSAPPQYDVSFEESDFDTKPWLKEFPFVIVINKATTGNDKQSVRIYQNQKLVQANEVVSFLQARQQMSITAPELLGLKKQNDFNYSYSTQLLIDETNKALLGREKRIAELSKRMWAPGVFKVSTGRDQFEPKGTHHSQKDSWSITPTGFFTPQATVLRHKSESYSFSACDSVLGKLIGAIARKEMCTYMNFAVFFNGSIAAHQAIPGTEPILGKKASGGCVRMPGGLAEYLYWNITELPKASIPVFSTDGQLSLDEFGRPLYRDLIKSAWGTKPAKGALFIVQEKIK